MKTEKRYCRDCQKYTLHDLRKEDEGDYLAIGFKRLATIGGLFWDRTKWYECQECNKQSSR